MKNYTKEELLNKKFFCVAPWYQALISQYGYVEPCCVSRLQHDENVESGYEGYGSLNDDTFSNIINSDQIKQLRKNMLNDKYSKKCEVCIKQYEANGSRSHRQEYNKLYIDRYFDLINQTDDDGAIPDFKPTFLDIRFSNLCNLKCRKCTPMFSSSLLKEYEDLNGPQPRYKFGIENVEKFINDITPYLQYVEVINFAGGEPFLSKEHYLFLKKLDELGLHNITINYNTNLSTLKYRNNDLVQIFTKFKNLNVCASLDDSYERGEYIRYGTKWNNVLNNINILKTNNIKYAIVCSVDILNIFHFTDFINEWIDSGLITINKVYYNLLVEPNFYSIQVLPLFVKEKIKEKLQEFQNNHNINSLNNIIDFMMAQNKENLLKEFFEFNDKLDKRRRQKLSLVIPEFKELIDYYNKKEKE